MSDKPLLTTEEAKALSNASTYAEQEDVMQQIVVRMRHDLRAMEKRQKHARTCKQAACGHDWKPWGNWEKICDTCGLVTSN